MEMSKNGGAEATRNLDLGPLDLIPIGEGRRFVIGSQSIAVFRPRSGKVYATEARCPHRGGPLADGLVGGAILVCPLHAYRFDLETGKPLDEGCPALKMYSVFVNEQRRMIVAVSAWQQ